MLVYGAPRRPLQRPTGLEFLLVFCQNRDTVISDSPLTEDFARPRQLVRAMTSNREVGDGSEKRDKQNEYKIICRQSRFRCHRK